MTPLTTSSMQQYARVLFFPVFAATIFAITTPAHAIERTVNQCLNKSPAQVHAWLVNYAQYKDLDDDITLRLPAPLGNRQAVDMISSSVRRSSYRVDAHGSYAEVWVILQPMTLGQSSMAYFPRFMLRCESTAATAGQTVDTNQGFTHFCAIDTRFNHTSTAHNSDDEEPSTPVDKNYGLVQFRSDLVVTKDRAIMEEKGHICPNNLTFLHYTFTITPNQEHITEIRTRILGDTLSRIPAVVEFVSRFFGEDFLAWYYEEFYNAWASRI